MFFKFYNIYIFFFMKDSLEKEHCEAVARAWSLAAPCNCSLGSVHQLRDCSESKTSPRHPGCAVYCWQWQFGKILFELRGAQGVEPKADKASEKN